MLSRYNELKVSVLLDDFQKDVMNDIQKFFHAYEHQFDNLQTNIVENLRKVQPYMIESKPVYKAQFEILVDFQEQMLTSFVPQLERQIKQLEEYNDFPYQLKRETFESFMIQSVRKILNIKNLVHMDRFPQFEGSNLIQSAVFPSKNKAFLDDQSEVYKSSARQLLKNFLRAEKSPQIPKIANSGISRSKFTNIVLSGHTDIITSVCLINDSTIASASGDGLIKLWDLEGGIAIGVLQSHTGDVWQVIPIQNEDICIHIASCGSDRTIKIWDIQKQKLVFQFVGHSEPVRTIAYLKEIDCIVSGGKDCMLKFWHFSRQRLKKTIEGAHKSLIKCFCYMRSKGLLLSGSADGLVKVWSLQTFTNREILEAHRGEVCCLQNISYNTFASGGTDLRILIWDVEQSLVLTTLMGHQDSINAFAFNFQRAHLWSVSSDRTIRIWDIAKNKQLKNIKRHGDIISDIQLTDQLAITASWDHKIRISDQEFYYL